MSMGNRVLPPNVLAECEHIRRTADAISAIGAVLGHDDVARDCEGEGEPLANNVVGGLHSAVNVLGDLILSRLEALELQTLNALHGPILRGDREDRP